MEKPLCLLSEVWRSEKQSVREMLRSAKLQIHTQRGQDCIRDTRINTEIQTANQEKSYSQDWEWCTELGS